MLQSVPHAFTFARQELCSKCVLVVSALGKAEYSAEDEGLCEQRLSGNIKIPFINIQLADGVLVVHEEIG